MPVIHDRARPALLHPGAAAAGWAALALFVLYGSIGTPAGVRIRAVAWPGISWPDIAQNVMLYVPFGTIGVWALQRDATSRTALCVRVVAIAFVYSSTMELLQMFSALRTASPLDVIANVVGAGAGAIAAPRAEQILTMAVDRVRPTGLLAAPARYVLAATLAAIVLAAWYPFDVTLDVSTLSDRTRAVRLDPWLRPGSAELWGQGARFFVVTAVMAACLTGLAKRAAPVAAVAAVALALVIDLGQLAMGSEPIGLAAFVSQAAGACAGAAASAFATGFGATRPTRGI